MKKNLAHNYELNHVVPFRDFKDMLEQAVETAGDRPGFKFRKGKEVVEVTYGQFTRDTQALGTALADLGLASGHIAVVGPNSYEWLTVFLCALNSEGTFVPVDKELPFSEMMHIINHSDCNVVFFADFYTEEMKRHQKDMPGIQKWIGFDIAQDDGDFLSYSVLMEKGSSLLEQGDMRYLSMTPQTDALKMIVYTSGTTGTAKGVMLSLDNLVSCVYYGLQISTVFDTCLSVLPYHHTYESVCGILVSMHMASCICINENLRTVAENLKRYHPSYIMLVPAFVESLYKKIWTTVESQHKDKALKKLMKLSNALLNVGIDMRHVFFKSIHEVFGGRMRKIVCGGAPLRAELGEFFETIGITVCNGYGITECSPLVSANRDYFYNWSSVGVTLPCIEVRIDSPNEAGEGEICVRGKTVMMGYYKDEQRTAEALRDGWFYTGDYGRIDGERLYITGRKKNLIVLRNGKNIYPEEIEDYIGALDSVSEVIVTAVHNDAGEETALCAEIYPDKDKLTGVDDQQIYDKVKNEIETLNQSLPAYKNVRKIIIRTEPFEKTTSGKIKRRYQN